MSRLLAQIVPQDILYVPVLWPGDTFPQFSEPFYAWDEGDARDTAHKFAAALQMVGPLHRPDFVTHSLGALVVLDTLRKLEDSLPAGEVILMAGAVEDTILAKAPYRKCLASAERVSVLSSVCDNDLRDWFPVGHWLGSHEPFAKALGYGGIAEKTKDSLPANIRGYPIRKDLDVRHGDYLPTVSAENPDQKRAINFVAQAIAKKPTLVYES